MTTSTSPTSSGSSADVTSSNSITCGSIISARAIATRCCWPPESWCGYWSRLLLETDALEQLARPGLGLAPAACLRMRRAASVRLSITRRCGNRLNCWNTIPIRCRTAETSTPLPVISSPSRKMRPESTGSSRLTQRSSVLLPLPLGPMTTSTSPAVDAQVDAVEHEVVAEALPNRLEAHHRAAVPAVVRRWARGRCPQRRRLASAPRASSLCGLS